ncbi:FAD-dependent monooxygenase [Winogradskyella eckloniae]|uniref:FAD-dependent monooxygenase n=1 Tax=Winogradskyella eckloniae TaxID=1089306 RepID=UPI00156635B4|nr:FAD-dependent monooxygenase [Winogradskyella eckloniae]NRD19468.1 FAD-dependent monooxygenase [Winogradskyella eckloniae]
MHIDIIGAGIGGLTTAIALEQKGIKTRIFEQSAELKHVGAGIILANNAMQVYEKLGLKAIIEANGNPISSMHITRSNLNPLSKIDLTYFEKKYHTKNIAIHRGTLQQILIDTLKSTEINLNHKLTSINAQKNKCQLTFENGQHIQSSIVLGADGLNSIVRQHILPDHQIRNTNQICWRGITTYKLSKAFKNEINEAWGKSSRFGFVQISENTVYWYAVKSFKSHKNELSVHALEDYFSHYNILIKDLIKSTHKEHIHTAAISDLKPTHTWFKHNVCLVGDAAHATTPNIGQGACQAIEDAFILSECLSKHQFNKAFEIYQTLRLPKVHHVVKTSWRIGKLAHLSNPMLIALRNQLLQITPASINRKQNEYLFKLNTV